MFLIDVGFGIKMKWFAPLNEENVNSLRMQDVRWDYVLVKEVK